MSNDIKLIIVFAFVILGYMAYILIQIKDTLQRISEYLLEDIKSNLNTIRYHLTEKK